MSTQKVRIVYKNETLGTRREEQLSFQTGHTEVPGSSVWSRVNSVDRRTRP